jgi:hypothetical protein
MRALMSPLSLLSPRRRRPQPPASPAFLGLLASPPPRRGAPVAPHAPRRVPLPLRVLRRALRPPRGLLPFLLGVALATLLFATAPLPGATAPAAFALRAACAAGGTAGAQCGASDGDALRDALAATRHALWLWKAALSPGIAAAASAALALALRGVVALRGVPPVAYAAAAAALALAAAALAAWRAVSRAAAAVAAVVSKRYARAHGLLLRRYRALHGALQRRSRAAAVALPHVATLGATGAALALAPATLTAAALSPPCLLAATLALPALASLLSLRAPASSDAAVPAAQRPARRMLAYWCALAPFLALAEAPLLPPLAAQLPGARALWALALVWLLAPATRGADAVSALLSPRLAPLGVRAAAAPRGPRAAAVLGALPALAGALRVPPGALAAASSVLRNATPTLLASTLFFLTPGVLTRYGAVLAGVLCPAASSLAALAASPPAPAFERGWACYWAVYGGALALAAVPPLRALLAWLPLAQHARLAAVLWLQLLSGAPRVAAAAARALAAALGAVRDAGAVLAPHRRAEAAATMQRVAAQVGDAGDAFALRRLPESPARDSGRADAGASPAPQRGGGETPARADGASPDDDAAAPGSSADASPAPGLRQRLNATPGGAPAAGATPLAAADSGGRGGGSARRGSGRRSAKRGGDS